MPTNKSRNERRRQMRNDRIKNGLCQDCGKPREENGTKTRCYDCKVKLDIIHKNYRDRLRSEGICLKCKGHTDTGSDLCEKCMIDYKKYNAEKYRERKESGVCVLCGAKPLSAPTIICEQCRQKNIINCKATHQKRVDNGRCIRCGKVIMDNEDGFLHCRECLKECQEDGMEFYFVDLSQGKLFPEKSL